MEHMRRVAVIGGGAAGMMAAVWAAREGCPVTLFEKNEKLGKKIYITGKGRCNLTNACPPEEFLDHVCSNRKFLFSAFHGFSNRDTMDFFGECQLALKTERGNRVFPVSDHASDVTAALSRMLDRYHVKVCLNTGVKELTFRENEDRTGQTVTGLILENGKKVPADAVIVCTGGLSYPSTGSDGDGYDFAGKAGHTVTRLLPSLVPMEVQEEDALRMQGLSLRNVRVWIRQKKKTVYDESGEMLFTHFGVSGPLILSASTCIHKLLEAGPVPLHIDLKPAISTEQLNARFLREFEAAPNKMIQNVLGAVYPSKMIPVMLDRCRIPAELPVHGITKEMRQRLVQETKDFGFTVTGLRGFQEAIITRGGVSVKEIRPDTMESKKTRGLFFAGEVLDLDGVTGGFNLQIAWSTGHAAGLGAARGEEGEQRDEF